METELREKIVIDGAESAAGKLGLLSGAANRVMGAFGHLSEIAGAATGIAGAWKIVEGVHEVDRLYQAVMRVQDMTGLAAEKAHAMFDMFELSGIPMESAERIMTSMTRKGAQLSDGLAGIGASTQKLTHLMTEFGVSIKDGPNEKIIALAKAAQSGKLDLNELIQGFAIPRGQASAMMSMLKQGPEKLREIQKDTMAGADVIDNRTLDSYRNMLQIRRELGDAWGDLIGVFYKNLIPAITATLKTIKQGFDDIAPIAAGIGKALSDHMDLVVSAAKTYLGLLVAAKTINMFSAEKMGVIGRGRQIVGGIAGVFQRRSAAAGAMDFFEAKAANPAIGMFGRAGGGTLGTIMAGIQGIGPLLAKMGAAVAGLLPALVAMGPVIAVVAAVFAIVAGVVVAFQKNLWGIRDALTGTFSSIWDHIKHVIGAVADVMWALWAAIKPVIGVVGFVLLASLEQFAWWLDKLAWLIDKLVTTSPVYLLAHAAREAFGTENPVDDSKRGTGGAPPATNMDFRGSKFEITNNFPPGIDGGRVAVAFGDELARLGERRLDSGVRPLFSYR